VLAIKDARVLSMNEAGSFEKATVVVDGDSIVELGENPSLAQDCELIHASGKYLLPGFIDSHNHIGLEEEIYRIEGSDVNEIADPITPQLRALDGINFWDLAFTDALRGGVTRSLTMPGSANLIGGQAVFLKHLAARPADMVYKHPWGLAS
jgi:imidazolonepropionase-like amidohydrolase